MSKLKLLSGCLWWKRRFTKRPLDTMHNLLFLLKQPGNKLKFHFARNCTSFTLILSFCKTRQCNYPNREPHGRVFQNSKSGGVIHLWWLNRLNLHKLNLILCWNSLFNLYTVIVQKYFGYFNWKKSNMFSSTNKR